jgi:hypothetical protein
MARIAAMSVGGILLALGLSSLETWPFALMGAGFIVLVLVERRYRGASAKSGPPGPWEATPEKFFDDETGQLMQVWYHPATGQRAYLPA